MSEELKKTSKCDRCSTVNEVKLNSGFLRIVVDPKLPKGWGVRNEKYELCANCIVKHDRESAQVYQEWFVEFMKSGKKQ